MGAGGEPGHVRAGLGDGVLGGTPSPARHRLGLLKLFLVRGQQLLDHLAQPGNAGGHPVDALAMALRAGVLGGEELRAFQRLFQLGYLAAGRSAGQLGQDLGLRSPAIR